MAPLFCISPLPSGWMRTALGQLALWLTVVALGALSPAWGQSQSGLSITTTGSDSLDVHCLMECSSVESNAVLNILVKPTGGVSTSDRNIQIVFTIASAMTPRNAITHRTSIQLSEGATSAQGMLTIPLGEFLDIYQQRNQYWNVSVLEDGRDIEAARATQMGPGMPYMPVRALPGDPPPPIALQRGSPNNALLHILQDGELLDGWFAQQMATLLTRGSYTSPMFETHFPGLARDINRVNHVRFASSLPEIWTYYLQFSTLTIHEPALAALREQRPKAAEAIKQFVAAGGSLVILAPDQDGPAVVEQWLQQGQPSELPSAWQTYVMTDETEQPKLQPATAENRQRGDWSLRSYARGRILIFNKPPKAAHGFTKLAERIPPAIGLASSSTFDDAWSLRNLIASVGKPPVWTFCAIVLLFGIVLGPGLLILTGWMGRRSLLILLVPLVSIGATLSIVGYQVLHEGFGTHLRISSVISVDEHTGDGFVWSRQTFYSGWPPREGMVIPNGVYFRPVQSASLYRSGRNTTRNFMPYAVQHEGEQSRWRGLLPAQEQKQFLIGHAAKVSVPIQVKVIDNKNITLRNLTDDTLPFVVLRDGEDGYYMAESIAPKAELKLSSQPFGDLAGSLSRIRNQLIPSLPAELRSMGWGVSQNFNAGEIIDQAWIGNLAEQSNNSVIPPYGFVTATHQCDAIFIPLKFKNSEQLHLISGSLKW